MFVNMIAYNPAFGLLLFLITVNSMPNVDKEVELRRANIRKGHEKLEMEKSRHAVLQQKQEQFHNEWKEVPKGQSNRKAWEEKLNERKKTEANIRGHEFIGKILMRSNVGVGQAILERSSDLHKQKQGIQKEMNTIKKEGHHDPELVPIHDKQYNKEENRIVHAKINSHAAFIKHDAYIDDNTKALHEAYKKTLHSRYSPAHLVDKVKDRIKIAYHDRKREKMQFTLQRKGLPYILCDCIAFQC